MVVDCVWSGSWSGWLPGPDLCGCRWLLFTRTWSRAGILSWCSSKESACYAGDARDMGLIPGSGRAPAGHPLQCSSLGNPMDRGAWQATVQRVAKSWTRLSDSAHMVKSLLIVESWGAPGLVLASHGESQGPRCSRAVAHTLVGETRSWAWCQTTGRQSWFLKSGCRARDPRVCFRSVVVGAGEGCAGSWHSWVWGPRCPGCVGLLLGVVVVQLVPGQGLACTGKSVS